MKLNFKKNFLCPAGIAFALTYAYPAFATEGGGTGYPSGIDTEYAAIVPPPGHTLEQVYLLDEPATTLAGHNGKNQVPDFSMNAFGVAMRTLHTWTPKLLGFNLSSGISPVFTSVSMRMYGSSHSVTGLKEIYFAPLELTKEIGTLHTLVSEEMYIPAGQHTPDNPASTSLGYYSFITMASATWLPNRHWDFSTWLSYETPLEDRVTHYHSGDTFNIDYGVTYSSLFSSIPQLALGVSGYFTKQMTNDTINGVVYNQGNKLQQFAVGPTFTWFFGPASAVSLKVQHQMFSRNTAQGNKIWLEYMFPL